MHSKTEFMMKQSTLTLYLVLGIIGIALSLILLVIKMIPGGSLIIVGILGMVTYIWGKNNVILSFKDQHIEMKTGPLAPLVMIPYKTIVSVEEKNTNLRLIQYRDRDRDKIKKIRFGLNGFDSSDREPILQNLTECRQNIS